MADELKFAVSRYRLLPSVKSQRALRTGALLRFTFSDGMTGYADCHPWHEMGDHSLEDQLKLLADGLLTPLTEKSVYFARVDAQARNEKRFLFRHLAIPKSHWHATHAESLNSSELDLLISRGVTAIKFKWGKDFREAITCFERQWHETPLKAFRLRFDFNSKLTIDEFREFIRLSKQWIDCVEFFEDPIPYDEKAWSALRSDYKIRLSCDREALLALDAPDVCDYLVVKPAIVSIDPFLTSRRGDRKLIVTSYLDHPIGLLTAAYTAAKAYTRQPEAFSECGLLTHHSYQPTPFCEDLRSITPYLTPRIEGTGWGYDRELSELKWESMT